MNLEKYRTWNALSLVIVVVIRCCSSKNEYRNFYALRFELSVLLLSDPNYPFEYLLDVIIAYQDQSRCVGLPDWLISGKYPEKVHVHYTAVPVSSLKSETTEDLERSLFKIWAEKEQKIQNFYKFGYFESEDETHKVCVFSNFRCVSLNLMYIFVTVFCAWPGAKLLYSLIV